MKYIWDEKKNISNQEKHGLSFQNVVHVFTGIHQIEPDNRFDYGEARFIAFGRMANGRLVVVTHAMRDGNIRIISARRANKREQKRFEYWESRNG